MKKNIWRLAKSYPSIVLSTLVTLFAAQIALADSQFAIIGDAGRTTASSKTVRESILRAEVKDLILPGDNLYSGSYKSVWSPWQAANFDFTVVAIGNHNGGYRQEVNFFQMPGEYYSKVVDGARFIVLNSDSDGSATTQSKWLETELKNARESIIFLVYHHPSYTLSKVHTWDEKKNFQRAIRPLIWAYRSKITALLVGHDHLATLVHFNDLPVIVSGAVHEQRSDKPINYTSEGVAIKTAWYFDRKPYWALLSYGSNANEVQVDFIRATDDKVGCTFTIQTGSAAALDKNCQKRFLTDKNLTNKDIRVGGE